MRPLSHRRLDLKLVPHIISSRFRLVFSNVYTGLYLDSKEVGWHKVYHTEPAEVAGPTPLLTGGEVCMWGEKVDASDVLQVIWPKAAAFAGKRGRYRHWWSNQAVYFACSSLYL